MTLSLRACAALLLPFVLASGNAFAYSQLRCRDGSIRETCCCTKKQAETPPDGPALSRSCCTWETISVDRTPGAEARRAPELSGPLHSFVTNQPAPEPACVPVRLTEREVFSDAGPPILLKTCVLLS